MLLFARFHEALTSMLNLKPMAIAEKNYAGMGQFTCAHVYHMALCSNTVKIVAGVDHKLPQTNNGATLEHAILTGANIFFVCEH